MTTSRRIDLTVNGRDRSIEVEPHHTLLEVLRDDLGLTGTKECCLVGECGACTVLVDGVSVDSCLMLGVEAAGSSVTTVEGLATGDRLHPLQQAFLDTGAVQCGFCIPGQLIAAHALLAHTPHPSRAEIEEGLAGNLCRCAGYEQIIEAVAAAAAGIAPGAQHTSRGRDRRPGIDARRRGGAAMTGRVGASPARVGGIGRVTGQQAYVADLPLDDVLHVKLVTLDVARARIGAIDTSAAMAVPGVRLVMTAADLPQPMPRFGPQRRDRPVLAVGETKYHGEPVAAVAAETRDAAEEAAGARARRVRGAAGEPHPRRLAGRRGTARPGPGASGRTTLARRPTSSASTATAGATSRRATREADVVIDGTWTFPMVTQFAIEPHAFMAAPDGDGIAIWSAIQHPYWLQRVIADLVGLPLAKVRVYAPDPGGAFGGKQHAKYEPLLAFMALATGRPVRLVLTLEETFQAVRRGAAQVHVRSGFRRDGTLVFRDIEADYLIGAYADIADRTVAKGSYTSGGPYRCPAARIVARSVLSHTVPSTAFRGFGNPQQIWAVESSMDEAARQLGIDPVALRLKNLAAPGEVFLPDDRPADGDWAQTVERAAEMIGWGTPLPAGRGRGLAVGLKSGPTTGLSYSTVRLLADGSVVVNAGTSDMGQGARTIFAQIAAQELGAPMEWVRVVMGDTAVVPYDQQTSASRSSVLMGNSVLLACQDIQAKIRAMAARLESVDEAAVQVSTRRGPHRRPRHCRSATSWSAAWVGSVARSSASARRARRRSRGIRSAARPRSTSSTARPSRSRSTGRPATSSIARHVTVSDVGKALNPTQVRGQDEGAAVMGLGHTLMEHYIYDDTGRLRNLGAIDYRIPTSMDLPLQMESDIVENEDGPGPYGAEGHERGRAPAGRARRGRGRARCGRRRDPRPAPDAGAGMAGAAGAGRPGRRPSRGARPMTYAYPLDAPHPGTLDDAKALVGGKAANLGVMARDLGLPVPPGFAITTATCREFLANGWPAGLDDEIRARMADVETAVGRRFGDPADPLLVSVRSGAPVSMPGMMDTILNLGLNDATTDGLARVVDDAFARSCRERFVASFRSIVGVADVPEDPWLQLRQAIEAVFRSWNSERARTYRRKEGIPDDLGTAVTVQAMVFGNRGPDSATGVLFTRNPSTGENRAVRRRHVRRPG